MPGCALRTSGEVLLSFTATGVQLDLPLFVPNALSLVGGLLSTQGLMLDPLANAAGLTVSNGLDLRLGRR